MGQFEAAYRIPLLAAGASTAYFGVEGAETFSFPLKNIADAINLRSHVMGQFEAANRNPGLIEEGALTFAVVGGGATGVETAARSSSSSTASSRRNFGPARRGDVAARVRDSSMMGSAAEDA